MPGITGWSSPYPNVSRPILASLNNMARLVAKAFDSTYYSHTVNTQNYAWPGLIVAKHSTSNKYVPYNASAAYGAGSDIAVGVIDELLVLTNLGTAVDYPCAPVYHGEVVEANCFVLGSALGTIPAAVKTALEDIEWK